MGTDIASGRTACGRAFSGVSKRRVLSLDQAPCTTISGFVDRETVVYY